MLWIGGANFPDSIYIVDHPQSEKVFLHNGHEVSLFGSIRAGGEDDASDPLPSSRAAISARGSSGVWSDSAA